VSARTSGESPTLLYTLCQLCKDEEDSDLTLVTSKFEDLPCHPRISRAAGCFCSQLRSQRPTSGLHESQKLRATILLQDKGDYGCIIRRYVWLGAPRDDWLRVICRIDTTQCASLGMAFVPTPVATAMKSCSLIGTEALFHPTARE